MKGRQAADGTRLIFNLLIAEIPKSPSVLLALDAKKAFDRVHWGYLQATLTKFGFQGLLKHAISVLYTSPSAQVFKSSVMSDHVSITNETQQGCPLSPPNFLIANGAFSCSDKLPSLIVEPVFRELQQSILL